MHLSYIPRKQIVASLKAGFRLIPGMEYRHDDYAVLMHKPDIPEAVSIPAIVASLDRPKPPRPPRCEEIGCHNAHHAFGMCKNHYRRWYRSRAREAA